MISTREEAQLMFSKWMESSSKIFFTAFRPDHTVASSFDGTIVGVSEDLVLIMGEGDKAEIDLRDAEFAFATERDLPVEVLQELHSTFDSGIFINKADGSTYAFLEVAEK